MKIFAILFIGIQPFLAFSQSSKKITSSLIVSSHLSNTSKEGEWSDVKTIYKETQITSYQENYKLKMSQQFPNLERIDRIDEHGTETFIKNSDNDEQLSLLGVRNLSILNYSVALSRVEYYGIRLINKTDTLINDTLMYRIELLKPIDDSYTLKLLLYFDSNKFYLRRVECRDPKYKIENDYFNFKTVQGYVFPFLIKSKKFNNDQTVETISYIKVNETFKPDTFIIQR